jgi:hypothetical protein
MYPPLPLPRQARRTDLRLAADMRAEMRARLAGRGPGGGPGGGGGNGSGGSGAFWSYWSQQMPGLDPDQLFEMSDKVRPAWPSDGASA